MIAIHVAVKKRVFRGRNDPLFRSSAKDCNRIWSTDPQDHHEIIHLISGFFSLFERIETTIPIFALTSNDFTTVQRTRLESQGTQIIPREKEKCRAVEIRPGGGRNLLMLLGGATMRYSYSSLALIVDSTASSREKGQINSSISRIDVMYLGPAITLSRKIMASGRRRHDL